MDALAGLLDGARARGAFLLRVVMDAPWSVRVQDRATLSLVAVRRGQAWIVSDGGEALRVGPGGAAIMRGPQPYTFADSPTTDAQVVIHSGQRCTTPQGDSLQGELELGARLWGTRADGDARLLVGPTGWAVTSGGGC